MVESTKYFVSFVEIIGMSPLFLDIIIGLLFVLFSVFAVWLFEKHKIRQSLIILILLGLILRLYSSSDRYLHSWDERYHALVAKHFIDNPLKPILYKQELLPYNYKDWTKNHIWLHKQPFPLWCMATSMYIFGVNEFAVRLPSIILSTIGIWLTFFLGRYFFSKRVGFYAAYFFAINGLIIELTAGKVATDHIDIFFLVLIEIAVFFSILFAQSKKKIFNVLVGISVGLAILSKWLPALIVLPIWILLVYKSGKTELKKIVFDFTILLIVIAIIVLPWQIYIFQNFSKETHWENMFNIQHITKTLEGRGGGALYHFGKLMRIYGEAIFIPLLWFVWKFIKRPKSRNRIILMTWIFVPLVFFSFVKTKMQAYTLFIAPAVFIVLSLFIYVLAKKQYKNRWLAKIIIFTLILLPVRYSVERLKLFEKHNRNPLWAKELKLMSKQKNLNNDKCVIFNVSHYVEAMFYSDAIVYPSVPEKQTIQNLVKNGYSVFINENNRLERVYANMDGVRILHLPNN